jgi:hypothetical protein
VSKLLPLLLLSGCVVSYQHMSDPRISNDGYDLVCAGLEQDVSQLRLRGDLCANMAPNHGEYVKAAIEWRPGK